MATHNTIEFVPSKFDHPVAIGVDTKVYYDNDKGFRRRSCYRMWRSLTKQQKIIFVLLGIILVSLVYVFLHKTRVPIEELEADREHKHELNPLKNPRKINREQYMKEVRKKLEDKVRPIKRGPPRLNRVVNADDSATKSVTRSIKENNLDNEQTADIDANRIVGKVKDIMSQVQNGIRPKTTPELSHHDQNNHDSINSLIKRDAKIVGEDENENEKSVTPKPKTTSEDDPHFNVYQVVNGVKIDPNKEKKEKELLDKYVPIDSVDYARHPEKLSTTERQEEVIAMCRHAWDGYKRFAWGHDELKPMEQRTSEWFMLGLTIVDSLDTLWLMNLKKEYKEGRDWVENELSFGRRIPVNLFEVTIRVLGGLLSIFHLTSDRMFLDKASDLGDRLMGAFKTNSKIPFSDVVLGNKQGRPPTWSQDSSLSEVATIQLEFRDLSYMTHNPAFKSAADNVILQIFSLKRTNGLAPIFINAQSGEFRPGSTITLGARGDSYYEYLLKQWLQTGKTEDYLKDEYLTAMEGVRKLLVKKSEPNKLTYVGELLSGRVFSPKMDHLVCFLPGCLALGYKNGLPEWHMDLAKELMETCNQMYVRMETGLSPEIAFFSQDPGAKEDIIVKPQDAHNLLRPETVESLHILYSITKDKKYQEYGYNILKAFNKYTKVPTGGYVSLNNVRSAKNPQRGGGRDKMESFFLAETLKYLFLLFSDSEILPLDKWVFNTEAHPLPIIKVK